MQGKKSKRRSMNLVSVIFFILAVVLYFAHEKYPFIGGQQGNGPVPVTTVHDGDTVSVFFNNQQAKVRLIGIDAPELAQAPWGDEAKKHLESVLGAAGRKVSIELDVEKTDQYGRILAYVWTADKRMINLEMIRSGYAVLYTVPPNLKYTGEFRKAQEEAREQRLGMWSVDGFRERPQDFRKKNPRI